MATRDITFVLNGQRFTIPLTYAQWTGIQTFGLLYNRLNYNTDMIQEQEFIENDTDLNVPFYIAAEGYPNLDDFEDWEDADIIEFNSLSITAIPYNGHKIVYRDWTRSMLQGFITASQWLGVNWRDYVTNITIDGQPAQID